MGQLALILADSAIETIPKQIWNHPSIIKFANSKGRKPDELFLNRSLHHSAMLRLKDSDKRGRPDLVHHALLAASGSPLYIQGKLDILVHTYNDYVINLGVSVRLPKSYFRFEGLLDQLYSTKRIEYKGKLLLNLKEQGFNELIREINPSITIGLSIIGSPSKFQEIGKELTNYDKPVIVVGGFPRGHFTRKVLQNLDALYSIHTIPLEAHVVVARIIYEYEKQIE